MGALGNTSPISAVWFHPSTMTTLGAEFDEDIWADIRIFAVEFPVMPSSQYQRGHAWRQGLPLCPSSYQVPRILPPQLPRYPPYALRSLPIFPLDHPGKPPTAPQIAPLSSTVLPERSNAAPTFVMEPPKGGLQGPHPHAIDVTKTK